MAYGLGKPRSKLGKFIDRKGVTQEELRKISRLNQETISKLCSGTSKRDPNEKTITKIIGALRKMGYNVKASDFWDV